MAVDSDITRIVRKWSKFRAFVPLSAIADLSLGAKSRLYSACVHNVMFHGRETWPVKEEDVIRLERKEIMDKIR